MYIDKARGWKPYKYFFHSCTLHLDAITVFYDLKIFFDSRQEIFFLKPLDRLLGPTQLLIRRLAGAIYLAEQWPTREVDFSPP